MEATPYSGLIAFLTFALSVIAAVLAIDMYALLRTGEFGRTWRILIIASVMFAFGQALRLASWFDLPALRRYPLDDIAHLAFVLMLGYAFYSQRVLFSQRDKDRRKSLSVEDRTPARRASDFFGEETAPVQTRPAASPDDVAIDDDETGIAVEAGFDDEVSSDIEWESEEAPPAESQSRN